MAIAPVENATLLTAANSTSHTSNALTLSPTDDNLLVSCINVRHQAQTAVPVITWPGGWTMIAGVNSGFSRIEMAYKVASSDGTTINVTLDIASTCVLSLSEYSGTDTSPLDQNSTSSGSGTSLATGSITTTVADELIVAMHGTYGTAGGGWGHDSSFTHQQGGDTVFKQCGMGWADRIVSSTSSYSTTGSWTNSRTCASIIASFKIAAAAGGHAHSKISRGRLFTKIGGGLAA